MRGAFECRGEDLSSPVALNRYALRFLFTVLIVVGESISLGKTFTSSTPKIAFKSSPDLSSSLWVEVYQTAVSSSDLSTALRSSLLSLSYMDLKSRKPWNSSTENLIRYLHHIDFFLCSPELSPDFMPHGDGSTL